MKQYAYQLWVLVPASAPAQDDNGDFVAVPETWTRIGNCRDETNSQGRTVTLDDSTEQVYDALIQLPRSTPAVCVNASIEVRDGATVRLCGTCKRFTADQLHSRLWV